MTTTLSINNIVYNEWVLDWVANNGWRLAGIACVLPNTLFATMMDGITYYYTKSKSVGGLAATVIGTLPLITIYTNNPWYLAPFGVFAGGVALLNFNSYLTDKK
jgi:hypothetical protein